MATPQVDGSIVRVLLGWRWLRYARARFDTHFALLVATAFERASARWCVTVE